MFLKRTYGFGYTLTIAKDPSCDSDAVAAVVVENIPGAEVTTDIGSELQIKLPRGESALFPEALHALETQQVDLKIDSMGISVTTLEEVFLRAVMSKSDSGVLRGDSKYGAADTRLVSAAGATGVHTINMPPSSATPKASSEGIASTPTPSHDSATSHAPPTFVTQVKSIATKNLMVARRNPLFFSMILIIPMTFMAFGALYVPVDDVFDPLDAAPYRRLAPAGIVLLQSNSSTDCTSGLCDFARRSYFPMLGLTTEVHSSITSYIYGLGASDVSDFNDDHHFGLVFNDDTDSLTAMFNGQYYHTVAVSLRTAAGIVLSNATTDAFDDISVANHPMPETARQASTAGSQPSQTAQLWSEMNRFAQAIFTGLLVFRPIKERAANTKLMQLVSGASFRSYWAAYFVIDFGTCPPHHCFDMIKICF